MYDVIYIVAIICCNDPATTVIYTYRHTLSLRDALPICAAGARQGLVPKVVAVGGAQRHQFARAEGRDHSVSGDRGTGGRQDAGRFRQRLVRSEEHTSELQSLMRISYAVFCLKNKKTRKKRGT